MTLPAVSLQDYIFTVAHAVDLVGLDDPWHGRRVGLLAAELAVLAGGDAASRKRFYHAGLLHDCGVSSTAVHQSLTAELEWRGADAHCQRGAALLLRCAPLAPMAELVRHHHTRWELLAASELYRSQPETALAANLVYLADRIDALSRASYADRSTLAMAPSLREQIIALSGSLFAPQWVEVFADASSREAFWLMLDSECVLDYQEEMRALDDGTVLSAEEFVAGAYLLADIIDAKSPFTAEHSLGVARLARFFASRLGLGDDRCAAIEIAGLLHDIGKLQIPDDILDSPCGLNEHDAGIMRSHSFATYMVLKRLKGAEEIARWAAWHHETPDGRGYPFHLHAGEMPLEARIIHVADLYQALAQHRPYRKAMSPEAILKLLQLRLDRHLLEPDLLALIAAEPDVVHRVAVGEAVPA
ncbi:HD-GYP domain-containing protein [Chitinilyticum piscinae]|uniref:HD domain-containing protein n=1 Tax=Chitinilyticum piscinae TaxID=2866724 RepID=A0A8J7FP08_9NEIS|nr:HD domain-containing phosphohydrolase [Chitinilyticum piscinae]MBE9610366.1 HD domain-containing protein [Chitinilyticum piscinae]